MACVATSSMIGTLLPPDVFHCICCRCSILRQHRFMCAGSTIGAVSKPPEPVRGADVLVDVRYSGMPYIRAALARSRYQRTRHYELLSSAHTIFTPMSTQPTNLNKPVLDTTRPPQTMSSEPYSRQHDELQASAADTLGGLTSGDVHAGIGHPGSGMSSTELRHDGKSHRTHEGGGVQQFGHQGGATDAAAQERGIQGDGLHGFKGEREVFPADRSTGGA